MDYIVVLGLWSLRPVIGSALAVLMFERSLHRRFPFFFGYVLFKVVDYFILFPIVVRSQPFYIANFAIRYPCAYWVDAAVCAVLGFAVIHEVWMDLFRPLPALKGLGTVLFEWALLAMLLAAVVVVAVTQVTHAPLTQAFIIGQRCVRVIQCGLILFLLVFASQMKVSWRRSGIGIALGFGLFAGVELVALAMKYGHHVTSRSADLMIIGAYTLSMIMWIVAMRPLCARQPMGPFAPA